MDTIPSEMLRGHVDTIILLSLLDCDKHTNQIKEEIESRVDGNFELKQGTFYSCLQRIVAQRFVTEYRSTDFEGKRRKYYQLTEKGKTYIEENKDKWLFSRNVIDSLIKVPLDETKIASVDSYVTPKRSNADYVTHNTNSATHNNNVIESEKFVSKEPQIPISEFGDNDSDFGLVLPGIIIEERNKTNNIINNEITKETIAEKVTEIAKETVPEKVTEVVNISEIASKTEICDNNKQIEEETNQKIDNKNDYSDRVLDLRTLKDSTEWREFLKSEPKQQEDAEKFVYSTQTASKSDINCISESADILKSRNIFEDETIANTDIQHTKSETVITNSQENDDYFDSDKSIPRDYKAVLSKLFPTPINNDASQYVSPTPEIQQEVTINEQLAVETSEPHIKKHQRKIVVEKVKPIRVKTPKRKVDAVERVVNVRRYDFSDIYQLAENEGFKVKTSSIENKKDIGKILINKLVVSSSFTFFFIMLIETAILAWATKSIAGLSYLPYIIFISVIALFPLISLIIYLFDPRKKVNDLISFKSIMEFSLILVLNLILIIFVFSIFADIDFSSSKQLILYIFYPLLFALNIPFYYFIKYLKLDNQRYFS